MVDTMTSWFSVSDALTRVAVMVCVVCVTGGQLGAVQGALHIPQCSAQEWLDILEDADATPYMSCEGFGSKQIVKWRIVRNNTVVASSMCEPLPSTLSIECSETSSDIQVYRSTDTRSDLYIRSNRRDLASSGRVDCLVDNKTSEATCRTNVISRAVLSDCEVMMTTHQTLAGTCNFKNAYSSNGTYTCTWTLTPTGRQGSPDIIISGDINKTEQTSGGKLYYRGTCSFIGQVPAGHYNYAVRFFPGKPNHQFEGSVTVPSSTAPPTTTTTVPSTTPQPTTTTTVPPSTTQPTTTTTVPPTTTESTSTTEPSTTSQHVQTSDSSKPSSTAQPATDSSSFGPPTQGDDDDEGVPLGAVIGGTVAAVVVIAVVVLIVVFIVIRRKRRKEDTGKDRDEDSDFEEHVNPGYVSAGELDQDSLPHQQPSKPSGVALCIPSNKAAFTTTSPTGQSTPTPATANRNTDDDYDYNTVEDEGDDTIEPGYSSVSFGGATRPSHGGGGRDEGERKGAGLSPTTNADNDPSPAPAAAAAVGYFIGDDGDYSSVDLYEGGVAGGGGGGRQAADDEDMDDVGYSAVGDTASEKAAKAPGNRGRASDGAAADDDLYAKVDKSSQRRELQPSASGGGADNLYAKVDKSSQRRDLQPSASGGDDASDDVGDLYAQVNKSAPCLRPAAPEDDVGDELASPPSTTAPGDDAFSEDYSHINLAHTGRGGSPAVSPPPASFQPINHSDDDYAHLDHGLRERENRPTLEEMNDESDRDVYVQVDKSSSRDNLTPSPPAPEEHIYQNPPKPKPVEATHM